MAIVNGASIAGDWLNLKQMRLTENRIAPMETTKPELIDRYLKIVAWARKRYTDANGRLVVAEGGHPAPYSRIEHAAAGRYLFGSR